MKQGSDNMENDVPTVKTLDGLIRLLQRGGMRHRALYHYTRWDAFAKMMSPVVSGACAGHRIMLLSRADKMNDKVEKGWGKNVFMTCFSYSKYEDVAMWMNYGKRSPDAVRVRIDGNAVAEWFKSHQRRKQEIFAAQEDGRGGFVYEPLDSRNVAAIELADVAYVIHEKLMTGRHWGNIEYSRKFYRVEEQGCGFAWSNNIYDGEPRKEHPALPAYFKKRGWGYERETRLVVTLKDGVKLPHRLALIFDKPFATLSAVSCGTGLPADCLDAQFEEERARYSIMRGPWFRKDCASNTLAGRMSLSDVPVGSDYASEIEIISSNRMSIRELAFCAEERLRELKESTSRCRPPVSDDDRRYLRTLGNDLRSAARTINHQLDLKVARPDPNRYKLARLEVIDPWRLAELAIKDSWALSYLNALREIAQSSGADWKHRISHVRKFGE